MKKRLHQNFPCTNFVVVAAKPWDTQTHGESAIGIELAETYPNSHELADST